MTGAAESRALLANVPQDGAVLGNPRARVRLVEYADLQCPACKAYSDQALPTLIERYVRPGRVALEFRHFPIVGQDSVPAARVAAAAGQQDRLWSFVELFYRNQGPENSGYVTEGFLRRIAGAVPGLDVGRALDGLEDPEAAAAVERGRAQAQRLGLPGTPSFVLRSGEDERVLRLEGGPEALYRQIDQALGR